MRYVALFLLVFLFLPFTSAADLSFDNYKTFERKGGEKYGSITIYDRAFFGNDTQLVKYTLLENTDACLINCYAQGTVTLGYSGKIFNSIRFQDLTNNTAVSKSSQMFTVTYENYDVNEPTYETQCAIVNNVSGSFNQCNKVQKGTVKVTKQRQINTPYANQDLAAGIYTWRIESTKGKDEVIDWIATTDVGGKELTEWAVWNSTYNVELRAYFPLNAAAGSGTRFNSTVNGFNGTLSDSTVSTLAGISNNSVQTTTPGGYSNWNSTYKPSGSTHTYNMWVKASAYTTVQIFQQGTCDVGGGGGTNGNFRTYPGAVQTFNIKDADAANTLAWANQAVANVWNMYTITLTSTTAKVYLNGVINGTDTGLNAYSSDGSAPLLVTERREGGCGSTGTTFQVDEVGIWNRTLTDSEVTDLWNAGVGIFYVLSNPLPVSTTSALLAPANGTVTVNSSLTFTANGTVTNGNLTNATLYLWNSTVALTKNTSFINGTAFNMTSFSAGGLADGKYAWNVLYCGTNSTQTACAFATANFSFSIDTTAPTLNLTAPAGMVPYQRVNTALYLNWTVSDANLQTCKYSYDAGNVTVTCSANNAILNASTYVNRTVIFSANDSLGLTTIANRSWNYQVFSHSESAASQLFGGSTATYTFNFSSGYNTPISSVILNYNGTSTYGTINDYGGDGHQATVSQYTAVPASSGQNKTGYWTVNFNDGSAVNTSTFSQTILTVGIDNCSANTQVIYNYSMLDEDDQTVLTGALYNTSIRVDFGLYSLINTSSPIVNYSTVFTKTNVSQICIQAGVLGNANYSATSVIQYSSANRVSEFMFIQNQSLTNTSVPYQLKLYDLLSTSSQSFRVTYKDQNLYPVPGMIIQVWRYYINEGVYKLVEAPITNPSGIAIAHLVPEDAIYTFIVTQNGRTVDTFTNNIVYCTNVATGDCSVNLQTRGSFSSVTNYQNYQNTNYTIPNYNKNTRVLSSSFLNLNAQAVTFSLNVSRFDNYGNQSLCNSQLTAPSGTVTCTIPATFANGTMIAKIYVDGNYVASYYQEVRDSGSTIFGNYRILLAVLLLATLPLISLASAGGMIAMFIVGGLICTTLFIIDGSFAPGATIVWLIIAGGTLLYKMSRRE